MMVVFQLVYLGASTSTNQTASGLAAMVMATL